MTRVTAVLVAVCAGISACASPQPAPAPAPTPAPTAPAAASGQIVDTTTHDAGIEHHHLQGTAFALEQLPFADWIVLPMRGSGSIDLDLRVPIEHGRRDWSRADGNFAFSCGPCQLGEPDGKVPLPARIPGAEHAFAGDSIDFGPLQLDRVDIAATMTHGHFEITKWTVASPDIKLDLKLKADFDGHGSRVDGCVRFAASETLVHRDPKTFAALQVTGAPLAADGMFDIWLTGPVDDLHRRGVICDGSQPLPAVDADTAAATPPVSSSPPTATPAALGDDDLAKLAQRITQVDPTHFRVPSDVISAVLANPLAAAKAVRVVPAVKDGKPDGLKLYAIRPDGLIAHLGFANGDTIRAVNGFSLASPDAMLEAYTKLRDAKTLAVDLVRHGAPMTLSFTIAP
jgi:hypothetical protein